MLSIDDLDWLEQPGNQLHHLPGPSLSPSVAEISDPPALLFVHGDPDYLSQPQLAIVGSRNPSHAGAALAENLPDFLAGYGLTITSGLATGIDAAAHRGALRTQAAPSQ